jgi:hypothetical protein
VRAFFVGFGIGAVICVLGVAWLFHGMNSMPRGGFASMGETGAEYSVIVKIKLSDDGFGSQAEVGAGFDLEDDLKQYIDDHPELGELDGDGYGLGYFDIYFYTGDRDQLVSALTPLIKATNPPAGSYIDTHVTETGADGHRIDL